MRKKLMRSAQVLFITVCLAACSYTAGYSEEPQAFNEENFARLLENPGLPSTDVRFYFANAGDMSLIPYGWRFDLSQAEQYHKYYNSEFIDFWNLIFQGTNREGEISPSVVFTTETTVYNFRFLEIFMNEAFWGGDSEGRAYNVIKVHYSLDELTPEIPFVVVGVNMGGLFAANGFSFTDESDITRYFAFSFSYYENDYLVVFHEFYAYDEGLGFEEYSEEYWGLTIEELGEIIVAAGMFWEEWWGLTGRFSFEHQDHSDRIEEIRPQYIHMIPYSALRPSSGLENINDVIDFLLNFYTKNWIYDELFHQETPSFVEYADVLFFYGGIIGPFPSPRPNWYTATHIMLEHADNRVVVETTVTHGWWFRELDGESPNTFEVTHIFVFIDGRIDSGPNGTAAGMPTPW